MKPFNHKCFEAAMADVLYRAYEAFPAPLEMHYEDIYAEAKEAGKIPDGCSQNFDHYNSLYGSTLEFLEREGVVFINEKDAFGASGLVLTSKGFLILNKPLESISNEHVTIGDQMGKAGKLAGTDILSAMISQTIGLCFSMLSK